MDDELNQEFLRISREKQNIYRTHFGNHEWTEIKPNEHDILKQKIGFAFYRSPILHNENGNASYNKEQTEFINSMFDCIIKTKTEHQDKNIIWVSFVCMCCRIDEHIIEICVIRVPKYDGIYSTNVDMFIDSNLRVYKNWQDYLENNKLPACVMCYPRGGKYFNHGDHLQLDTAESPQAKTGNKVLKFLDDTAPDIQAFFNRCELPSSVPGAIGTLAVNVAVGGYIIYRRASELHDRRVHKESIGLGNEESRYCYLGIATNVLSIAASTAVATITKSTQNRKAISKTKEIMFKSTAATYCAVKFLSIANEIANIILKFRKGELTDHDISQIVSSVLFFADCVVNTREAYKIINEANKNNTDILKQVAEITKASSGTGDRIRKIWKYGSSMVSIVTKLNNERTLLKEVWDSWNEEMNIVMEKLWKLFGKKPPSAGGTTGSTYSTREVSSTGGTTGSTYFAREEPTFMETASMTIAGEGRIFEYSLETSSAPRSETVEENSESRISQNSEIREEFTNAVIEISKKFADREDCDSPIDYLRRLRCTCNFIRDEFLKEKNLYEKFSGIIRRHSPDVTEEELDRDYGIQTNRNKYFLEQVMKQFKSGNGILKLRMAYSNGTSASNDSLPDERNFSYIAFENEEGLAPNGWFNRNQYFEKAEQLMLEEANEGNVAIEVDGSSAVIVVRGVDKIINVTTMKAADGKLSGIAVMLCNNS